LLFRAIKLWRYAILPHYRLIQLATSDNYSIALQGNQSAIEGATKGVSRAFTRCLRRPATVPDADHWRDVFGGSVRKAVFDPDQLETLMVAAFELLGKPEDQAQELALSILRAAERPQSGDPRSPDQDLK
jgi:hypothetical protein